MTIKEPSYKLVDCDLNEWRFQESEQMQIATEEFDKILFNSKDERTRIRDLKLFLKRHPDHIDALHHYAIHLRGTGKYFECYIVDHTAVAVGKQFFPKRFIVEEGRLPTGFVQNRPFLRSMHGLMIAQYRLGLIEYAAETGRNCLRLDVQDRFGTRQFLPLCLLDLGLFPECLKLFEDPAYKDTFEGIEYLHSFLFFKLDKIEDAKAVLKRCLRYHPYTAKYILNPYSEVPKNESAFGVTCGSETEGWMFAKDIGSYWRADLSAFKFLADESTEVAKNNWTSK